MSRYAKSLAAFIGAVATWGITALEDNAVTSVEWFGLLAAIGTVVGVWGIANRPPEGEPSDPDVSEVGPGR